MYRHFQTFSLKYFLIINIFLFFFVEWFCGRRRWWWWGWRWTCSLHTLSPPSHLCVMPPPFFMPSRNKPMKKLLFFTPLFFTLLFNAHNELKTQILKVCYYLKSTKAEGGQTLLMRRTVVFLSFPVYRDMSRTAGRQWEHRRQLRSGEFLKRNNRIKSD